MNNDLRIAGRLALHGCAASTPGHSFLTGYHGADVLVRQISGEGFVAHVRAEVPVGILVRLRLPGMGVMVARVTESWADGLNAAFLNPVGESRLRTLLGRTAMPSPLVAA